MHRSLLFFAVLLAAGPAIAAEDPIVTPLVAGGEGRSADPATLLVADQAALAEALSRFHDGHERLPEVDFAREVVLVVNAGPGFEAVPPACAGTLETDAALSVLIHVPTWQTAAVLPGSSNPHPMHNMYLFLRLPRQTGKPYSICFGRRHLLVEAPRWTECARFAIGDDGKVEELKTGKK